MTVTTADVTDITAHSSRQKSPFSILHRVTRINNSHQIFLPKKLQGYCIISCKTHAQFLNTPFTIRNNRYSEFVNIPVNFASHPSFALCRVGCLAPFSAMPRLLYLVFSVQFWQRTEPPTEFKAPRGRKKPPTPSKTLVLSPSLLKGSFVLYYVKILYTPTTNLLRWM